MIKAELPDDSALARVGAGADKEKGRVFVLLKLFITPAAKLLNLPGSIPIKKKYGF
jgi:hypothetical protein